MMTELGFDLVYVLAIGKSNTSFAKISFKKFGGLSEKLRTEILELLRI
jgi:hypothetical protein